MQFFQKMNTVFYRLIFSYFLLIIITTIFMGATSYIYFTKNFNSEIERVNSRMLAYLRKIIDEDIFRKTHQIYIDLTILHPRNSSLQSLFDQPIKGNHARIHEVNGYLKEIASLHSDLVDSIQVYYRENDMIISSLHGVSFANDTYKAGQIKWVEKVNADFRDKLAWYHFDQSIVLVGSYPYTDFEESKGYVAIFLKNEAIASLITETTDDDLGRLFIVNPAGVIPAKSEDHLFDFHDEHIDTILASDKQEDYFISNIGGIKTMVSYVTLDRTSWQLVNVTPVVQFYSKSVTVQRAIMLICFIALLIGIVISNIFSLKIYNPLRAMVASVKKLFYEENVKTENENEYTVINNVIDNLSIKVIDLEKTLHSNLPLIKSNLVEDLFQGKLTSIDEVNEKLAMISQESLSEFKYFNVIIFQLDEVMMGNLSFENSEFIKFNLIEQLENTRKINGQSLAYFSDNKIYTVVLSRNKNQQSLYHLVNFISTYAYTNFMISIHASVGGWTVDPFKLAEVYAHCEAINKYHYFEPNSKILSGFKYVEREESKDEINEDFIKNFVSSLKKRDIKNTEKTISFFLDELINGNYSAAYCHEKIRDFLYEYYSFVKKLNLSTRDILSDELLMLYNDISNINQLKTWLYKVVQVTFVYIEERDSKRNYEVIDQIKIYIRDNLNEDLSLDQVAEVVHLSPRYLSRIFKQHTNINFVDYITEMRMNEAGKLLCSTNMNIEDIANKLNYSNPSYFSKKFKEVYGLTPTNYRIQNASSLDKYKNNDE